MKTNAARGDGVVLTCCCRAPGCSASSLLLDLYLAVSGSDPSGSQRSPPSGTADELQPSRSAAHRLVRGLPGGQAPPPTRRVVTPTRRRLVSTRSLVLSLPPWFIVASLPETVAPSRVGWASVLALPQPQIVSPKV